MPGMWVNNHLAERGHDNTDNVLWEEIRCYDCERTLVRWQHSPVLSLMLWCRTVEILLDRKEAGLLLCQHIA